MMKFDWRLLFWLAIVVDLTLAAGSGSGSGSGDECKDKNAPGRASDCPQSAYLCNNPIYKDLMTQQCPGTCKVGGCGGGSQSAASTSNDGGDCKDKNAPGRASDCPSLTYLCGNAVYADLMKQQCPSACKIGKCGQKDNGGSGSGTGRYQRTSKNSKRTPPRNLKINGLAPKGAKKGKNVKPTATNKKKPVATKKNIKATSTKKRNAKTVAAKKKNVKAVKNTKAKSKHI